MKLYVWLTGFVVVAFLAGWIAPAMAETKERSGIMVWELEKKSGVSIEDIDSISGFITLEVERRSGRTALSDADILTILQGEEKRQKCGAESASCIAEIGAALGVPEAISGDLGRLGEYWILNLRRINVRSAEVISRSGVQLKGDINRLIEAIPSAVAELFEKTSPETAQTPPKAHKSLKKPSSNMTTAAYATFFTGVGLTLFGGVAHWQMNQVRDDYAAGESDAKSRHTTWKGMAATGYALGGALMATGVTLWIVEATGKKKEAKQAYHFGASPMENGVSVCLWGSW